MLRLSYRPPVYPVHGMAAWIWHQLAATCIWDISAVIQERRESPCSNLSFAMASCVGSPPGQCPNSQWGLCGAEVYPCDPTAERAAGGET